MTSALFQPITLRSLQLANRIMVSPMCQYSAEDGAMTDWHIAHLSNMAMSGAAIVFIEATGVELSGRITYGCTALCNDETERAMGRVVEIVRRIAPANIGIQLGHAGRKASSRKPWEGGTLIRVTEGGWMPDAPSAVPQTPDEPPPHPLDAAGLQRVRRAFADSARRAARIGLQAVELHMAHGYLLHEFLSPITNRRDDAYGGSLHNRMRFPLEVFETVREALPPDLPCGVRVSCSDWIEGGWDIDQTVEFARELKRRGCDWLDCSSGGLSPAQKITVGPGYQVPFARRVKADTGITTIAIGMITEPKQAETIIAAGDADMVALARGMLYNPRWGWHAAAALGGQVSAPKQYWRATPQRGLFQGTQ